jgi:hypothetical protein
MHGIVFKMFYTVTRCLHAVHAHTELNAIGRFTLQARSDHDGPTAAEPSNESGFTSKENVSTSFDRESFASW